MRLLVQTLTLGILLGGIYSLLAVGLSLVFGVLRLVNFAHGETAMLGSYAAFFAADKLGAPVVLSLFVALVVGGVVGYLTNSLALRPLYSRRIERPAEYAIIVTFMLSQVLMAAAVVAFGPTYRKGPGFWSRDLNIGGWVQVSGDRIVAFGAAVVFIALLMWIVYRTNLGAAWRALTQNALGARVVGIDVQRYANLAVATSGVLAAAGATLLAPLFFVYPTSGSLTLAKAFVIVVIGGLGSIEGTLLGGLTLGLVESFGATYLSSSYRDAYGFLLMILVLLLWPRGLFGKRERAL